MKKKRIFFPFFVVYNNPLSQKLRGFRIIDVIEFLSFSSARIRPQEEEKEEEEKYDCCLNRHGNILLDLNQALPSHLAQLC